MANGGTKIYCPECKSFTICKAVSPSKIGMPKAQRWHRTDHKDIAWFRRGRECLSCGHLFATAEVHGAFIQELIELRKLLAQKQKQAVKKIRRRTPWIKRGETIPLDVAQRFIRETAWWIGHPSGGVRAPKLADRIYQSHHGWAIDFGANTFLVGKAIERCRDKLNDYFEVASTGQLPTKSEVRMALQRQVSGAVANIDGYEYSGYYPIENRDLVFGTQSIDVQDAANFMISESGINELLIDA